MSECRVPPPERFEISLFSIRCVFLPTLEKDSDPSERECSDGLAKSRAEPLECGGLPPL